MTSDRTPVDVDPPRLEVLLLRTARHVRRAFDERLGELGLNLTEASMLTYLRDLGGMTQRELSDHINIGRAAAGSFVDRLEKRNLVRREADPADRRVWIVNLTPEAHEYARRFDEIDAALLVELRSGMSRDDRRHLAEILLKLEQNALTAIST